MKGYYAEFIKKHFPFSNCCNNEIVELLYLRVCENNLVTDIFEKYICAKEDVTFHSVFLQRYRNQMNRLLLYIPLNEPSGINFCMRATIENLIKFFYSIYFNEGLQNITRKKFRDLKEGLNKAETDIFIDKNKMNIIFNFYGNFSNYIHDKVENQTFQLEYMESIIKSGTYDLSELDTRLIRMLNIYESLICSIFKIEEKTFSSSEILRLKNSLPAQRSRKIMDNLYKK